MNYYEAVYIIHPALQEGRLNDIVNKFHKKLEDVQGKVLYVTNWGKKKLAYPIDKQKYGTYILCQYTLNGENIKNISQELELNPNILRYLITKIDESKILEGSTTLDIVEKDDNNNKTSTANTENIPNEVTDVDSQETKKDDKSESNNEEVAPTTDNDNASLEEATNDDDKNTNSDESSEEITNDDDKNTNSDESSEETTNDDDNNTDKKD